MWAHSLGDGDYWTTRLPWLLPGLALAAVVGIAAGGRLGRWLGVSRVVAWMLVMTTGAIVAGTMSTVQHDSSPEEATALSCDLSRIGPTGLLELTRPSDPLINVLLFIPLGFVIALIPGSSRRAAVLVGAFALPFVIEATQSAVTSLGRGCESADVSDNLTGLILGLIGGTVVVLLTRLLARKKPVESVGP